MENHKLKFDNQKEVSTLMERLDTENERVKKEKFENKKNTAISNQQDKFKEKLEAKRKKMRLNRSDCMGENVDVKMVSNVIPNKKIKETGTG